MKPVRATGAGADHFPASRTTERWSEPVRERTQAASEDCPGGGPDEPGDPWVDAMRRGDFDRAWAISDSVLRQRAGVPCWHLPRHEQYIWSGAPLAGKRVLVRCYHGLGDTVQFIRYAPLLKRVAREVLVWAQPMLLPLLESVAGIDELLPLQDGAPGVPYEADIELMELPHYFRTTPATVPANVPYLRVPEPFAARRGRRSAPRAADDGGLRGTADANARPRTIGIIWQSGSWDDRRSLPTALLEPLTRVPGIRLHALQQGGALQQWPCAWGTVSATPDPSELARRMCALDLVITVDSFPAHLAGALGVRTWTLLHADPDWRWMLGRDDSPWYPTMRLWRQETPGDWPGVISRVAAALNAWSAP